MTIMETLLELANYYQLCRGEFQWKTLVWLSLGIVLFSLFWQIRLGRKGLTPARSILTIMAVGYPVLVFMSKDIFDFVTIEPDGLFLSVIVLHLLVMILFKWVYDLGCTSIRKILYFLYPIMFAGGFFMLLFVFFLLGSDFAEKVLPHTVDIGSTFGLPLMIGFNGANHLLEESDESNFNR